MTTPLLKPPSQLAGRLVVSGDPEWDEARRAWNLAVDQRPRAVVYPEAVEDVVAVVELARSEGLRVAVQCTGHNAAPVGSLERAILLKTERMRQVEVDPVARTARCEAGVLWPEVGRAAAEHGLAPLAGTSPDVGVVGYTIGGGVSWVGRKHGLAANSVLAVELVTAEGGFVRADRDNESDLFWALRGGGG
jgi:FAD/FMN-containing dehydrogenase